MTANDAGKVYGQPDPALTTSSTGFMPADVGAGKITFTATRAPGESAQSYDMTPAATDNGTSLLANYTTQLTHGAFTISKAPLTITADNKSRPFGTPNPVFTVQYTGLAGADTVASLGGGPLVGTVANQNAPNGSYPITVALGSIASTNYSYSFVNGVLTVGTAAQTITFNPMRAKTFGDGDFDPGATTSSGLAVTYVSASPGVATVAGAKIRVVAPGTSDITASQGGDGNWDPAPEVLRTLTVNPPPWNGLGFDGIDDVMRISDAPQLNFGSKAGFAPGMPFAAITDPVEDVRTEQESILVRGAVGAQGSAVTVALDVDGTIFTPVVTDGTFQQQISLRAGSEVTIAATVTDGGGKSSAAYRNIVQSQKIAGDVNCDGRIDVADAMAALRMALRYDPVTPDALAHADVAPVVDGVSQPDGSIDVGDVLVILRKVVGLVDF